MKISNEIQKTRFDKIMHGEVFTWNSIVCLKCSGNANAVGLDDGIGYHFDSHDLVQHYPNSELILKL